MIKADIWPPPPWPEIVIPWSRMLDEPGLAPEVLDWVERAPGGYYHLHGYKTTEGFSFRFQRPEDATMFALRWV